MPGSDTESEADLGALAGSGAARAAGDAATGSAPSPEPAPAPSLREAAEAGRAARASARPEAAGQDGGAGASGCSDGRRDKGRQGGDGLLRELASAARRAQESREMSPARALRLGLARAAAQLHDLPLQVTAVQRSCLAQDDIAAACDSGMLLALLDGPEGARGAIGLDPALVAALIEVQVMGAVGTRAPEARALTPTDAAMVAPWLDAALERVDQALAEAAVDPPDRWLTGYRFGAMAEDAAALALALDAARFHLLRLTVDVALGRRIGTLLLALPAAPPVAEARPEAAVSAAESFLHVPADLRVIAGRLSLPLSRAAGLAPGDLLPLPDGALERAELLAVDGSLAGRARLGRMGEHWALRFGGPAPAASPVPETMPVPPAPSPPDTSPRPRSSPAADLPEIPALEFDEPQAAAAAMLPPGEGGGA